MGAIALCCAFILFSQALPVMAIGSTPSSPTQGEAQLDAVQKRSEDALKDPPLSLKQVQDKANEGINEIQGDADYQKMNRPGNSRQATSVEEQVENVLHKIKGDK